MSGVVLLFVTHHICGLCVSRGRDAACSVGVMPAVASLQITLVRFIFEAESGIFLNKQVFLLHLGCIFVLQWNITVAYNPCREKYLNAKPMCIVYL